MKIPFHKSISDNLDWSTPTSNYRILIREINILNIFPSFYLLRTSVTVLSMFSNLGKSWSMAKFDSLPSRGVWPLPLLAAEEAFPWYGVLHLEWILVILASFGRYGILVPSLAFAPLPSSSFTPLGKRGLAMENGTDSASITSSGLVAIDICWKKSETCDWRFALASFTMFCGSSLSLGKFFALVFLMNRAGSVGSVSAVGHLPPWGRNVNGPISVSTLGVPW